MFYFSLDFQTVYIEKRGLESSLWLNLYIHVALGAWLIKVYPGIYDELRT